jgi:hypothetical protein
MNLESVRDNCKATAEISNSAKLLAGLMKATGVSDAKTLSETYGIPLRTIQRLKLEVATADANSANSATGGGAKHANDATDGVSECANSATGGVSQKEIPPIPPKEKTTLPSTTVETNNLAQQQPRARESAALQVPADLSDRLIEACNGSLDNPVNCMGLLSVSTPIMWLNQGCDLELDVLPTLRAAGQKYHGKRIRDWSYFTGMVAEAKAKRERGLPVVAAAAATAPKFSAARAVLEARKAREVHA